MLPSSSRINSFCCSMRRVISRVSLTVFTAGLFGEHLLSYFLGRDFVPATGFRSEVEVRSSTVQSSCTAFPSPSVLECSSKTGLPQSAHVGTEGFSTIRVADHQIKTRTGSVAFDCGNYNCQSRPTRDLPFATAAIVLASSSSCSLGTRTRTSG